MAARAYLTVIPGDRFCVCKGHVRAVRDTDLDKVKKTSQRQNDDLGHSGTGYSLHCFDAFCNFLSRGKGDSQVP